MTGVRGVWTIESIGRLPTYDNNGELQARRTREFWRVILWNLEGCIEDASEWPSKRAAKRFVAYQNKLHGHSIVGRIAKLQAPALGFGGAQ